MRTTPTPPDRIFAGTYRTALWPESRQLFAGELAQAIERHHAGKLTDTDQPQARSAEVLSVKPIQNLNQLQLIAYKSCSNQSTTSSCSANRRSEASRCTRAGGVSRPLARQKASTQSRQFGQFQSRRYGPFLQDVQPANDLAAESGVGQ